MSTGTLQRVFGVAILVGALACAGESSGEENGPSAADLDITTTALSGMVGDQPWTVVSGTSNRTLTTDGNETIVLCSQPLAEPCGLCDSAHQIQAIVPPVLGSYSTDDESLGVRFATVTVEGTLTTSSQITATAAILVISNVTDSTLEGGLAAQSDLEAGYQVTGQFAVTRCENHFTPDAGTAAPE